MIKYLKAKARARFLRRVKKNEPFSIIVYTPTVRRTPGPNNSYAPEGWWTTTVVLKEPLTPRWWMFEMR